MVSCVVGSPLWFGHRCIVGCVFGFLDTTGEARVLGSRLDFLDGDVKFHCSRLFVSPSVVVVQWCGLIGDSFHWSWVFTPASLFQRKVDRLGYTGAEMVFYSVILAWVSFLVFLFCCRR